MHNAPDSTYSAGLVEQLSTGIIVLDRDNKIVFLNQAAETVLQMSRSKARGLSIGQVLEGSRSLSQLCERSRSNQATYMQREIDISARTKSVPTAVMDVAASPIDGDGLLLELRDAKRLVQIDRENSLLAQHDVGQAIVSQLAHEIKNPLGGLRGAAQLLAKKLAGQNLADYTDVIIREADRLVALVNSMLGPTGPAAPALTNIHRLLDHVSKLLVAEAPEAVVVTRDYDPSLPDILIDENRMIQALLNLGRNALQAVGDSGDIILRTRALSGFTIGEIRHALVLRIDFEDSGPGVPENLIHKIFYPLVTGRADGTGLGLAVAQDLLNRHAGLVKLIPGERTVFSVFLPFANGQPAPGDASAKAQNIMEYIQK